MRERQKPQPQPNPEIRVAVQTSGASRPEQARQRYVPDAATAKFIEAANALVRRFGHANYDPSLVRGSRSR